MQRSRASMQPTSLVKHVLGSLAVSLEGCFFHPAHMFSMAGFAGAALAVDAVLLCQS